LGIGSVLLAWLNGFSILPYSHKALTFSSYTNLVFLHQHSMELLLDRTLN